MYPGFGGSICEFGSGLPRAIVGGPQSHYEDVLAIAETEFVQLNQDMRTVAEAIQKAFASPRMNYAILGNEVAHVHWHIIPRYHDDPNWGRSPWPIQQRRRLSGPQYQATAQQIRQFLIQQ